MGYLKIYIRFLIVNIKNSIKLTAMSMLVFLTIGFAIAYTLIKLFNTNINSATIIAAIISMAIVLVIDFKKTHFLSRAYKNQLEMENELDNWLEREETKQKQSDKNSMH